nr:unnamed protein product [Digitaria exilis]
MPPELPPLSFSSSSLLGIRPYLPGAGLRLGSTAASYSLDQLFVSLYRLRPCFPPPDAIPTAD